MSLKISATAINPTNTNQFTRSLVNASNSNQASASANSSEEQQSEAVGKGTYLYLSEDGLQMSRNENKNQDIDDSDLPNEIKDLLRAIRELKELLRERTLELKQLMANKSLTEEQRDLKAQQLQIEIAALNSTLLTTMGNLVDAQKEAGLSLEQSATFARLLLA